jgi:hypothetical protein
MQNPEPRSFAVSCPGGRWGRRRTRVSECVYILRAEHAYTTLLKARPELAPGDVAGLSVTVDGRVLEAACVVVANRVWRRGRVFLVCLKCERRATRLYLPTLDSPQLACRRCWGLTYDSRTLRNYKDRGPVCFGLRFSHRMLAHSLTESDRERRREAAEERYAQRRRALKPRSARILTNSRGRARRKLAVTCR